MSDTIKTHVQNTVYANGFDRLNWSGQDIEPTSGICAICPWIGTNGDGELRCYYHKGRCADEEGLL